MLNPDEFNKYPAEITKLFEELEKFILMEISRRILKQFLKIGEYDLTPTAINQIQALEEMGVAMDIIKKKISETEKIASQSVEEMFNKANVVSFEREKAIFKIAGKELVMSASKKQILDASIKNATGEILNFTGSIGMKGLPLEKAYHEALNTAYLEVMSGSSDYISAIKRQVKALADSGLQVISYQSGRKDQLDVAVRRALLTGLKQTTNLISEINALEMGCDGYEISAHNGARPTHQIWQGRQFAIHRATAEYPLYSEVVGDEMNEPNCRHSKWGIFLGVTKSILTTKQIAELDKEPFVFSLDGKEYNSYKATQKQRTIERAIRKTKRNIIALDGLDIDVAVQKAKLRQQQKLYREFSKEAGLRLHRERTGVAV